MEEAIGMLQEEEAGDEMGLSRPQLLKIPIAIYSPFFPKSAALRIKAERGLGSAQKIRNPELDSWRISGLVGKELKQKVHSWSRTKKRY